MFLHDRSSRNCSLAVLVLLSASTRSGDLGCEKPPPIIKQEIKSIPSLISCICAEIAITVECKRVSRRKTWISPPKHPRLAEKETSNFSGQRNETMLEVTMKCFDNYVVFVIKFVNNKTNLPCGLLSDGKCSFDWHLEMWHPIMQYYAIWKNMFMIMWIALASAFSCSQNPAFATQPVESVGIVLFCEKQSYLFYFAKKSQNVKNLGFDRDSCFRRFMKQAIFVAFAQNAKK